MARTRKNTRRNTKANNGGQAVAVYQHKGARRKNNPPAALAAEGTVPAIPKAQYHYSPRRPPELRFDPTAGPDKLPELIAAAGRRPLTKDEQRCLAEALRSHEPWLEWAEKQEQHRKGYFEVDPVALHIHERISTQAILRVAARQDLERSLFADPEQEYRDAVQFYRHDIDWTNRLILGDSLQVMSSLARREDLAGKVQMIYIDPPYGIKFASNFQPEVGKRDVKEKDTDLTRELEMVKAYRDTWHLGIHSYLSYLRDRLLVARELLADTASIFVQISSENLQRVTILLDEVFGIQNRISLIAYRTSSPLGASGLPTVCDFLLWYAQDSSKLKFKQIFEGKEVGEDTEYVWLDSRTGERRRMTAAEKQAESVCDADRVFARGALFSSGFTPSCIYEFEFDGRKYMTASKSWRTNRQGMERLVRANRLVRIGELPYFVQYHDDFSVQPLNNLWTDTRAALSKVYVVETSFAIVERCMLMTTDPGDLVLDPTCGSGTTAYVAEQWGRRWITIDTSRVAIAIARQRLLTAKFHRYRVKGEDPSGNGRHEARPDVDPHPGFVYRTVPHITLRSIAQNTNLDPIFVKHEPILDEQLGACNAVLVRGGDDLRWKLQAKLEAKQRAEGKRAITDADRRRWLLPPNNRDHGAEARKRSTVDLDAKEWYHWEVPFDTDPDWPKALQSAVTEYRRAWRAKMDEVNACIAANAAQEELVDQPEVVRGVVRVSGPFTVEAVQPPELSLSDNLDPHTGEGLFDGEPESLPEGFAARTLRMVEPRPAMDVTNIHAYLDKMIQLLRGDGVRFPNNQEMAFSRLEPIYEDGTDSGLHAEGRWMPKGKVDEDPHGKAAVSIIFGPQYGPVTSKQVVEAIRTAFRRGYEDLVVAGFSFDGPAHAEIEDNRNPKLRVHIAHIRPDINPAMEGLLKETPSSQLFTVFGQPRTKLRGPDKAGLYTIEMEGVDIYDPVQNRILATNTEKVAAWFIDGDYDGRAFCITQAFFPDKSAWDKLARGNEVMAVHHLK